VGTEVFFRKIGDGTLLAVNESDREALYRIKVGQIVRCEVTRSRSPRFHRKAFALFNYAYSRFEPVETKLNGRMVTPQRDFDEFRKWLTIKAGFFDVIGYPDGSVRARAQSLSYANMEQEKFERVYSNVLNAAIEHVLLGETSDEVNRVVEQMIMEFA
jgi:hypothetical protein